MKTGWRKVRKTSEENPPDGPEHSKETFQNHKLREYRTANDLEVGEDELFARLGDIRDRCEAPRRARR
jgi:hypothetical protein